MDKSPDKSLDKTPDYSPEFVQALFDEMSGSYDRVNLLTSFGFSERWRRQCVAQLQLEKSVLVYDLMTGAGEAWPYILPRIPADARLVAVDFSAGMLALAERKQAKDSRLRLIQHDLLDQDLALEPADHIISIFGLKTFSTEQQTAFARRLRLLLKPGGSLSLLEISEPEFWPLRMLYMFYLKLVIPLLGKLLLGNPENYRMLGRYTASFGNCTQMSRLLREAGFTVSYRRYFFGCATGIVATLPV